MKIAGMGMMEFFLKLAPLLVLALLVLGIVALVKYIRKK